MRTPEIRVTGRVQTPRVLDVADLAAVEQAGTGGDAPNNTPSDRTVGMRTVIELCQPDDAATHCTVMSSGGAYRASIPLGDLAAGGRLTFAAGLDPLPDERGGPFRLIVVGGATLCWNVKDVAELRFTQGAEADDVPENPPH